MNVLEIKPLKPIASVADLEHELRKLDPSVRLMHSWLLRRVVAADLEFAGPLAAIPHASLHRISSRRLAQIVETEDLPIVVARPGPEGELILLAAPREGQVRTNPARAWEWARGMLLHAWIDAAAIRSLGCAAEPSLEAQKRFDAIGPMALHEASAVLQRESLLGQSAQIADVYREFAAVILTYAELRPELLKLFFPSVRDIAGMREQLLRNLDASSLAGSLGLVPSLTDAEELVEEEADTDEVPMPVVASELPNMGDSNVRAQRAADRGNLVRAGLLRRRMAQSPGTMSIEPDAPSAVPVEVELLAQRLGLALRQDGQSMQRWKAALRVVFEHAGAGRRATGRLNAAARYLYDLQKACIDHERPLLAFNLLDFVWSFGSRPLRRPVPRERLVLMTAHLRSARRRLAQIKLTAKNRAMLESLTADALHQAEHNARNDLRPWIAESIDRAGLHPRSCAEAAARRKVVEELVDVASARAYLNFGDLRDALSQNQLKLPDTRPRDLFARDTLLRIDQALARNLEGVYRPAEIYLRLFHRLSAVLFGTSPGRLLTRFVLLPAVGSYVIIEGLDHTIGLLIGKMLHLRMHFTQIASVTALAIFLLLCINWRAFANASRRMARAAGRGVRAGLVDVPRWIASRPILRRIGQSRVWRWTFRYGIKPLGVAAIAWLLLPRGARAPERVSVVLGAFLLVNLMVNSRLGRAIEQTIVHGLMVVWTRFTVDVLAGAIRAISDIFGRMVEGFERALYAVDEYLRFRPGQSRAAVVTKFVAAQGWAAFAYIARFCVNLLVEPQVNPLKHFPVVTVSHKLLLPLAFTHHASEPSPLAQIVLLAAPISAERANAIALSVVWGIPGIFGFLAWELRSNWRLYRANQPTALEAVRVGSHGETIARLLRPGFHSGTLPKLFAKLRRAASGDEDAWAGRRRAAARHHLRMLEHVREDVAKFVEREMISLLGRDRRWQGGSLRVANVQAGPTHLVAAIESSQWTGTLSLGFQFRCGTVVAWVMENGWASFLHQSQSVLLAEATTGLFQMAGASPNGGEADCVTWRQWVALWEPGAGADGESRGVVEDAWLEETRRMAAHDHI